MNLPHLKTKKKSKNSLIINKTKNSILERDINKKMTCHRKTSHLKDKRQVRMILNLRHLNNQVAHTIPILSQIAKMTSILSNSRWSILSSQF